MQIRPIVMLALWGVALVFAAGCQSNKAAQDAGAAGSGGRPPAQQDQTGKPQGQKEVTDTTAPGPPPPGGDVVPGTYSQEALQSAVRNFADQYRKVMANVSDTVVNQTDDPGMRQRAFQMKLDGATAAYDTAADPLPASAMLNHMVMISLQVNMLKRHGEQMFGKFHPQFLKRSEFLQESIYATAAKVMSNDQRRHLLAMCKQWSEQNPEVRDVAYVRLDDLPGIQSSVTPSQLIGSLTNLPGEFLNKFNPFAATQQAAGEATALAERMSWLAPRLMILAQWRAEALIYESLSATEIRNVLQSVDRVTRIAQELPDTIDHQREALFSDLSQNEGTLTHLLGEARSTIDEVSGLTGQATTAIKQTDTLTNSTDKLVQSINQVVKRLQQMQQQAAEAAKKNPPKAEQAPGRPFDITEYTEAIRSLNDVVKQTNTLVNSLDDSTSEQALQGRLDAVQGRVSQIIWLSGLVVLGVALVIILAVKFIPSRRHKHTP